MHPTRARLALLLLTVPLLSLLLAGCWDQQEIEDRALILGMAIDRAADPADLESKDRVNHLEPNPIPADKMIRVTASIAVPGRIPLGPGEGGGGSGGQGTTKPVWVVTVFGHTVNDALNNLQQQIADPKFLVHLRVIVVSEDVAYDTLEHINDYFRRDSEVRRRTWLLISRGEAARFLNVAPPLERVPTLYVLAMLEKSVKLGKFPRDYIGTFWSTQSKQGQEGYLPYVDIRQKENILIGGMALFRNNKMVGTSEPLEIGAFMSVKQMNPAGYSPLVNVPGIGPVMTTTTLRKSKIDLEMKNGSPRFKVMIYLEQDLEEKYFEDTVIDEKAISKIEEATSKEVNKIIVNFIRKTQRMKSDIFGFGEYIRAKEHGYWTARIGSKEKWEDKYADLPIEVQSTVRINRTGMQYR
ncbi:Ger(x)C family spore germination protein [Paenibacillus chitinolyticus]|uniref:Ger(x)C family spore germination protein n=1 Tax=Paenibacillus chitinolyticus TaxID=79263 RepID=UPI00386F7099